MDLLLWTAASCFVGAPSCLPTTPACLVIWKTHTDFPAPAVAHTPLFLLQTGTDGQWWLDWDREYKAWKGAGLPVDVSYQFGAKDQPPAAWGGDPYSISYTLGYKFTRHFGPTQGTGNVVSFEAGNEPCKCWWMLGDWGSGHAVGWELRVG